MRRPVSVIVAALILLTLGWTPPPAQGAPVSATRYRYLDPGGQPNLTETVPVNVVFVGYNRALVDRGTFRKGLASSYQPVVRSRLAYGQTEKLGITYRYDYDVRFAGRSYDDRFFAQLKKLGRKQRSRSTSRTTTTRPTTSGLSTTTSRSQHPRWSGGWRTIRPPGWTPGATPSS